MTKKIAQKKLKERVVGVMEKAIQVGVAVAAGVDLKMGNMVEIHVSTVVKRRVVENIVRKEAKRIGGILEIEKKEKGREAERGPERTTNLIMAMIRNAQGQILKKKERKAEIEPERTTKLIMTMIRNVKKREKPKSNAQRSLLLRQDHDPLHPDKHILRIIN